MKEIKIDGKRFNRLTAINKIVNFKKHPQWLFKCDCGNYKIIDKYSVMTGETKSCGCFNRELSRQKLTIHGFYGKTFYKRFRGVVGRCNDKTNNAYKMYGAKGIKCLWNSFEEFKQDMYESYKTHVEKFGEGETTIDRIDGNGNYCKENCRWATYEKQAQNTKNNKFITYKGKTGCYSWWEKELGLRRGIISARILDGWDKERALTV